MNIMIDLETMSSASNAAILSIGAVHFDSEHISSHEFYVSIKPISSIMYGGMDPNTIAWWMQQTDEARQVWNDENAYSLDVALYKFTDWVLSFHGGKNNLMWANGPDFDCVILANAYNRLGVKQPWSFRNHRCFRTLKGFFHNDVIKDLYNKHDNGDGARHNALYDARLQAKIAFDLLNRVSVR
jgi:hypothetical protein